jgi:cytochrome c556
MHRYAVPILLGLAMALPSSTSAQAPAKDERKAVALTEPTFVFVLTEMRNLMDALQGVMEAAGSGDWAKAAAAADKSGMKAAKATPKEVTAELPEDIRKMSRQMRLAFDAVAETAAGKRDAAAVSAKLAETMLLCNTCHQGYRFTQR